MLGAAERHTHSRDLIREFSKQLDLHIEVAEFPDRKAYFGYPTVLKNLAMGRGAAGKTFQSSRYAEGDSVVYEDVAAIFHGPLDRFYGKEHHFGPEAKRVIVVAAL